MTFDIDGERFDTDAMHTFHVSAGRVMLLMFTPDFDRGFVALLYRHEGIRVEELRAHHLQAVEAEDRSPAVRDAIAIYRAHACSVFAKS